MRDGGGNSVTELILDERGYFWWASERVPKGKFAPDNHVAGELKISEQGQIDLRLNGLLARDAPGGPISLLFDQTDPPDICGILASGTKHVRLSELHKNGSNLAMSGPSTENLRALRCLISTRAFGTRNAPKFQSIKLDLDGFEEWLELKSITVENSGDSLKATYDQPAPHSWNIAQGKLGVEFTLFRPYAGSRSALDIKEKARITFRSKPWFDVEGAIDLALRFEEFLLLLTDSERGLGFPVLSGKHHKELTLYYSRQPRSTRVSSWPDLWTRFPDIAADFGAMAEVWLKKYREFGPGFHLYFGNRRGMRLFYEHKFANLIWGLETFHRQLMPPSASPPISAKVTRILGEITLPKDRKWAAKRLKIPEPPLDRRLFELFNSLPLPFNAAELQAFCARCADRRNDMSHFGGMRAQGGYEAFLHDLTILSDPLDMLYHAKILTVLGLDPEHLTWWFTKGPKSYRTGRVFAAAGISLPTS